MKIETRNSHIKPVISLTPSESNNSLSNFHKSPHYIKNNDNDISSDDEREFEKFIMLTACNTGEFDTDQDTNINNDDVDTSIISFIAPQINKMQSTKHHLSRALSKAKSSYSIYKQGQCKLNQTVSKYESKKERLRNIYNEYNQYEIELKKFEEELKDNRVNREKRMKVVNGLNDNLNKDIETFNEYFNKKIEVLKISLNEAREYKENNEQRYVQLLRREQEISMRQDKVLLVKQEIESKEKEFNIEYLSHKANDNNDNEMIQEESIKDKELNYNIQDKEATLELLNQQIKKRNEELDALRNKNNNQSQETINTLGELNTRLASADVRENEILLLQKDLEYKLKEVNEKLLETQKITQNLQLKEDYINALRNTNKSVDEKLSCYEINKALTERKLELLKKK